MNKKTIHSQILIIIIFATAFSYIFLNYYSRKITPTLLDYIETKNTQVASQVISNAIEKEIDKLDTSKLLTITKNDRDEIQLINFNTKQVILTLSQISKVIEENLKSLENSEPNLIPNLDDFPKNQLIYSLHLGAASNNPLLSNLGPEIPIKLEFIGDVLTNIETNITEYGINNALLEVSLKIEINMKTILPFSSSTTKLTSTVPVTIELIQGHIPSYFYNNGLSSSSNQLQLPLE